MYLKDRINTSSDAAPTQAGNSSQDGGCLRSKRFVLISMQVTVSLGDDVGLSTGVGFVLSLAMDRTTAEKQIIRDHWSKTGMVLIIINRMGIGGEIIIMTRSAQIIRNSSIDLLLIFKLFAFNHFRASHFTGHP